MKVKEDNQELVRRFYETIEREDMRPLNHFATRILSSTLKSIRRFAVSKVL